MSDFCSRLISCVCPWMVSNTSLHRYHRQEQKQHQQLIEKAQVFESPFQNKEESKTFKQDQVQMRTLAKQLQNNSPTNDNTKNGSSYQNYINSSHPYYKIIFEKLCLLNSIFDIQYEGEILSPQSKYNLSVKIKQSQDKKTNIFSYSFQFPTNHIQYESMLNDFSLQKIFDSNIEDYQCKQQVDTNTKIIYLCYKRMWIVSPRDFMYVRYTFEHEKEYWSIATSIPGANEEKGKTRGTINLTATKVVEDGQMIRVNVYSHVDMKIPITMELARKKGVSEIKKYLDKCYEHIQTVNQ